jgi:hypothetical protein
MARRRGAKKLAAAPASASGQLAAALERAACRASRRGGEAAARKRRSGTAAPKKLGGIPKGPARRPDEPTASPPPAARRVFEIAVAAVTATLLAWQVLVPPIVGLADNGDFWRIALPLGIAYHPGDADPNFFRFVVREYMRVAPQAAGFPSSELLFAAAASLLQRPFGGSFDIRWLGAVHALALLAALVALVAALRRFSFPAAAVSASAAAVLLTDAGYVPFLNSFYSEPASLIFFLLVVATAVIAAAAPHSRRALAAFAVAGCCFLLAKPQNVVTGPLLAAWVMAGPARQPASRRTTIVAATALLAASVAGVVAQPSYIRDWTRQVAVFHAILGESPDPASDLSALDLDPALVSQAGRHPWSEGALSWRDPGHRRVFFDRITFGAIARFYLLRPARLWEVLDRSAAEALRPRLRLGHFERGAAHSRKPPAAASRLKELVFPASAGGIAVLLAAAGAAAAMMWRHSHPPGRAVALLVIALLIAAAAQFLLVAITQGTIDTIKHMFLFRLLTDTALVALLAAAVAGAIAVRRSPREKQTSVPE